MTLIQGDFDMFESKVHVPFWLVGFGCAWVFVEMVLHVGLDVSKSPGLFFCVQFSFDMFD